MKISVSIGGHVISRTSIKHVLVRDLILAFCIAVGLLITFSLVFSAEIRLDWSANSEPDIAGYRLYYGRVSGIYDASINVGNATSYILILPERKYFIALTAHNSTGNESDFSNEVSWPIQVLEPNGVEAFRSGSSQRIQWWASSEMVRFKLMYSMDNGATWTLITDNVKSTRSYDWTVPVPAANRKACFVKVIGYDSQGTVVSSDRSDSSFRIEVVRLTAPNTAETLISRDIYPIAWETYATKGSSPESVELYYTKDAGKTWNLITVLDGISESFDWLVSTVKKPRTECKVKVILRNGRGNSLGSDVSDVYFTIQP
jgi:hypothetical protein